LERILTETDSPYLTPVPRRGKRNEPAYVRYILETIAALKNEPVEKIDAMTTATARTVFGIV
jgi:TatD DNase family protein